MCTFTGPESKLNFTLFNACPSSKVLCTQEIKLLLAEILLSSPVGTKSTCEPALFYFFWWVKIAKMLWEKIKKIGAKSSKEKMWEKI
jgi:hypothetical protein